MTVSAAPTLPTRRLRDLPMTQQLFLWTVRHTVCAAEDRRPVCALVPRFFDDAGLPDMPQLVSDLLRRLSAAACAPLTVNVPCGVAVLPDEERLLADLEINAAPRARLSALRPHLKPGEHGDVAGRLHDIAARLDALHALRGPCHQPVPAAAVRVH